MEAFKPSDILSKHFLYKPHLILYSKCFLTIGRSGLILDSLPFQFDQREYIRFDDLLDIHSSEKKALCREFSLRVDKKTSSSLLTFVSYDRTSLLMSLYKAFDLYIYENRKETHIIYPELIEFSGLFLDSFNEGKKGIEEVKVVLFRTSLLVFFQNWNDNIEGFNSLDILSRESLATSFKEEKSFFSHKTIWLDYDKLKGIRRTASGVIFFTKTSKIGFNFLTYDSEKTNILIETVQKRVFLHLESKLESFEDEIPIKIDKENASELLLSQYCLVNAEKLSFSGIKRSKIILALSEAYLTEINPENKQILNKWPLKMITYLIRHEFDFYGLELLDQDDIQARYILCSSKRDIFLNNIIHLMNSKTNNNIQNGKKLNFLHSKLPDLNLRVFGFLHNEPEPEYELETVKKIFLAKTLDETIVVLKEFNLNCTCVKLSEPDPKPYHSLYQLLNKLLAPILKPDISNFMENYFSWIYFKNSSIELSGSDVELSDIKAEGFKERMLTILQEEPKLFQEGEEALQSMLTIRNLIDLLQKIEEVIKGLSIMSQSSVFFRDIGNYKKDDFYENIFALIIGLNDNSNELLAFLATNLIRSVIQFGPGSDKKYEIQNRSLLINKKPSLLNKIVESLAYKTLFGSKNQESHYSLSLKATLQIFESLFISHRDSTSPEDLIYIYKVLTSKIVIAATSNICRCESYSLLYKSTVIFNHLFKISLAIKSSFKDLQALFMNNTCLILLHMFHGLSNVSCTQRKESMLFFSYMLSENQTACSLLIRLVPKCLLSRISTSQSDISKWGLPHWEEFFGVLSQNFNTPTEQWNDACRKELLSKVKNADEGFFRKRRDITEKEITLNNNDINIPESKLLSLKWNYEEFSIEYEALRPKFLVWKYYLSCLIRDKENPIITIAISQPLRLWNELNTSFISSLDELEKEKILKTLILLYRFHYHHIREINAIPYWVHLLRFEENEILRYLILQLLFCSFTREENTVNKLNIKRLFESYGIEVFFELLSGLHYIPDPNDPILDTPIHNFTQADFIKAPAESITSLKTNIIHFILNMFRILLNKQKPLDELDREVFPHPFIKTSCLQELHLEIIINTLLIPNEEINLLVLQILKEFFLDRISYQSLLQSRAFFEILLSKINEKTIKAVMEIVIILYERVCEDPELPNYIEVFLNFDFEALDPQIIEESLGFFRFLKFFPKNLIWRLFNQGFEEFQRIFFQESFEEPNLIWTSPMREKVFHLIHNHLEAYKFSLLDYSQEKSRFRLERLPRFQNWVIGEILHENIEKEVRCGPLFLRVWNLKSQKHFYIEEDMINRFLVLLGENLGVLVLNKTEEEFKNSVQPEDLLILLHSHSKAIKRYEIHQYTSFDEVIYILNYFSYVYGIPKKEESPTNMKLIKVIKFLNHGLRLVYRAIRIPNSGNLENFLQTKGFDAVFNTLQALVSKCFLQKKTPEYLYYYKNMDITAKDLGSLCLSLKILRFLLQNARLEIIELDPSRMFELCHLLQKVSKVPLVYFEFLKCRKRKKNIDSWEKVVAKGSEDKNLFEELNFDQEDIKNEYNPMEFYEKKIFFLMNDLAMLWVSFSTDVALLDSLIRAGVPWRCLEFAMLYEENFEMGGFDYEKTQRINEICEDCVLILRNLTIFAHEVFILKNTSFCEAPGLLLEKVVMAKQRSELLFNEISRLNKKKKDILKAYFEGLQTILMRKSVGNLLEDYYEALEKPEEKDKRGIKKFLKLFNKDCEEEMFIWTQENREDLKEVLKIQLSMINEDSNKDFMEKIVDYQYGNHLNELSIEGIFVRIYNKNNSKLNDFPRFLKQIFYEIYARVKFLEENNIFTYPNTNNTRLLKGRIFDVKRLIEALKAISNVLKTVNLHGFVMEKTNFDILVRVLADCDKWFIEMRSYLTTLQLELYNILENLITNSQEILSIISNKSLMRTFFYQLKSNIRNDNVVIEKLLKILWNLSLQGQYFKILGLYGFIFVLFEISLKKEIISKSNRIASFKLLLKLQVDNEFQNMENFFICIELFPLEIKKTISENMNVSDFIDYLDLTIETPYFIWRKEMRQEIWKIISEINDVILMEIESFGQSHISMYSNAVIIEKFRDVIRKPEFPILENEVIVRDIFIRNFNKFPNFNIKLHLAIFIEEISSKAQEIYLVYAPFLKQLDSFPKKKLLESQNKLLDRNFCMFLTLISGLLLSIEQLTYNKTNPQGAFTSSSFVLLNAEESHYSQDGQKPLENSKFLSEEALTNIIKWLDLLNLDCTPISIKSTLLQIAFLITDIERGMMLLKSNGILQMLVKFHAKYIKIEETVSENLKLTFVEEILGLNIILKILLDDHKLFGDFISSGGVELFLQIYEIGEAKKYLDEVILNTFAFALKEIQYCDFFEDALKKKDYIELEDLKKMKPIDYRFLKLWRVFKITETFNNDTEKTLEYYHKRNFRSFLFPLISNVAYEALPHPEPEIYKKIKNVNNFVDNSLSSFDKNERTLIKDAESSQENI